MKRYDFDEIIERRGTDSIKWDGMQERWGRNDLQPMWVADMDFRTPPFVMEALRSRLQHEVLGYTSACGDWSRQIVSWLQRHHHWTIRPEWLLFVPGVVRGLAYALLCFTRPGDRVLVMPPVYHPFFLVTQKLKRQVVCSPLSLQDGQYHIDFARLRRDVQGCRMLILCNPHNPGGRVWSADELKQIASICQESGTLVVSDEIHADLTLPPHQHHPYATVCPEAQRSITFMAPSKAFNMPGLGSSYAVVPDDTLRQQFLDFMEAGEFCEGHMLAYLSCAAAYREGDEWLSQMLDYVKGNIDFTEQFLKENLPAVGMIRPQASYLIFLDCRALGLTDEALHRLFVEEAHLALNEGTMFDPRTEGNLGSGFMRLNVGCPRSVLHQALLNLQAAISKL